MSYSVLTNNQNRNALIGIGSWYGDDQIGWRLIDELSQHPLPVAIELKKVRSPLEVLDQCGDLDWIGICDACHGAGPPGTLFHCIWPNESILHQPYQGTHDLSLHEVLQLGVQLEILPSEIHLWGIEVELFPTSEHAVCNWESELSRIAESLANDLRELFSTEA